MRTDRNAALQPPLTPAGSVTHVLSRAVRRLSEGPHPWGIIDVTPNGRTVWSRTRLTVYPPGINTAERRALRFYRSWPVTGVIVALLLFVVLSALPAVIVTVLALLVYVGGVCVAYRATRKLRPRLRSLSVTTIMTGEYVESLGDVALFDVITSRLRTLDELNERGLVSSAEFEFHWSEIYDALPER